jgi:hypothetical protein
MVAMGLMEILVLLLIAFFLIGVPMVIIGLVIYISRRQPSGTPSAYSNIKRDSVVEAEKRKVENS